MAPLLTWQPRAVQWVWEAQVSPADCVCPVPEDCARGLSQGLDGPSPCSLSEASPGLWVAGYSHLTCWEGSVFQCHKMRRSQRLFLPPSEAVILQSCQAGVESLPQTTLARLLVCTGHPSVTFQVQQRGLCLLFFETAGLCCSGTPAWAVGQACLSPRCALRHTEVARPVVCPCSPGAPCHAVITHLVQSIFVSQVRALGLPASMLL